MENFKVIIVEDVKLELKGTEEIFRTEIPEAQIIGTAQNESELWKLFRVEVPDLLLLDLGLGGSTTALAVNIETYPTHIAGLPVAVNICCHVNRHKTAVI